MSLLTDASRPVRPLPELLAALRDHGLRQGVDPGPMPSRPSLGTGHPALDGALGSGGWPRGALAQLDAPPGAGATTLALGSLAEAQAVGAVVAYLDPMHSLDPATAARMGIDLRWLLVVRPASIDETIELAAWLARDGRIDMLVLDLAGLLAPSRALDRLAGLLVRSGTVALLLGGGASRAAGVRVELRRSAWLATGGDLVGQRVEVVVARHRWALAGGRAELDLWFAEGRRIDPLLRAGAEPIAAVATAREQPPATLAVVGA